MICVRLFRPEDVREYLAAVTEVTLKERCAAICGAAYLPAPLASVLHIDVRHARACERLAQGRSRIEMRVYRFKHLVIVRIRMLIACRIASVIHAGTEVRIAECLILMIESEDVAHFLAHHKIPPCRRVICSGAKVRVVELYGALRDVVAGYPYRRNAEPSVLPIFSVAHFSLPCLRPARLWTPSVIARDDLG